MQTVALNTLVVADAPIIYGILMPGVHVDGGVPVVKVRNMDNGRIDVDGLIRTSPKIDTMYRRSRLRAGDILLSIRGTTGLIALVPPHLDGGNITQDSARIRIDDQSIREYLVHALASPFVQRQIGLHTIGQAVKGINIASVRKLQIPLPENAKRRDAITRLFRALDRLQRGVGDCLAAKQRLKRALLQQLLTGKRHFPGEERAEWHVSTLGDLCEVRIGRTPSRDIPRFWATQAGSGRTWLKISDLSTPIVSASKERVTQEGIDACGMRAVPEGTVLMSFKLTIGRIAITGSDLFTNEAIAAFVPRDDRISPAYLAALLPWAVLTANADRAVKGATLNKAKLVDIVVRLPGRATQNRVAAIVRLVDYEIALLNRERAALSKLKHGLLQVLLTGELDGSVCSRSTQKEALA